MTESEGVYRIEDCAVFFRVRERHGALSNMAGGFPIAVGETVARSSEALYQAMRFPHRPDLQEAVLASPSPMGAKMVTKPHRDHESRADWMAVRVPIMRWVIRAKLIRNFVAFGDALLATEGRPIVERSSKDAFWGAMAEAPGILRGQNVLGGLLDELYRDLVDDPLVFQYLDPPVPDMLLLGEPVGRLSMETSP